MTATFEAVVAGRLIISELRERGPNYGAPEGPHYTNDEYVEIYTNTDQAITVNAADGSGGSPSPPNRATPSSSSRTAR